MKMDLYLMNADGSEPIRLTEAPQTDAPQSGAYENVSGLTWSPDGTRIAFSAWSKGTKSDIYSVDVDGSNAVRLTERRNHPNLSPEALAWRVTRRMQGDRSLGREYDGTRSPQ